MTFLLDSDTCSASLKEERKLFSRFIQHAGQIATSRIVLAELYSWAYLSGNPQRRLASIEKLIEEVTVFEFDDGCARQFGILRTELRTGGISVPAMDLLIAASAVANGATLVTHNTQHFKAIPGLTVADWLT